VSTSASKKDLALTLGASEYLNAKETNVVERIQALGGAKLILCTAPYSKSINELIPAVGKNGM
jgi:propanol-preferring alcohol dehydrogenase